MRPDYYTSVAVVVALFGVGTLGGCGDGTGPDSAPPNVAMCGAGAPLSMSPVPLASIHEIAPLGSLFPPGHTTPTGHIYFYFAPSGQVNETPVPLVAPGDIVITEVLRQTRTGGGQPPFVDYMLTFFPCSDLRLFFGHVTTLDAGLTERIGPLDGNCRPSYSTGGFTYQQCPTAVQVAVAAGTPLGTVSGPGQGGLDFGGTDRRVPPLAFVNPSRSNGANDPFGANRTICPVDYFAAPVRTALQDLFGRGTSRRTVEPVCGEVMQDVPGTAQGRWFSGASASDDMNLALVHDNVDPSIGALSVGTAVPTLPSRVYRFMPQSTGRINTDFHLVSQASGIHCYDATDHVGQLILLQLVSGTRLRIEGKAGSACGDAATWAFTGAAAEFER